MSTTTAVFGQELPAPIQARRGCCNRCCSTWAGVHSVSDAAHAGPGFSALKRSTAQRHLGRHLEGPATRVHRHRRARVVERQHAHAEHRAARAIRALEVVAISNSPSLLVEEESEVPHAFHAGGRVRARAQQAGVGT